MLHSFDFKLLTFYSFIHSLNSYLTDGSMTCLMATVVFEGEEIAVAEFQQDVNFPSQTWILASLIQIFRYEMIDNINELNILNNLTIP